MPDNAFYTDRIGHAIPRTSEEVSYTAWGGVAALIQRRILDGSLARAFPKPGCNESPSTTGTNEDMFFLALGAHVPDFGNLTDPLGAEWTWSTETVLDAVDFTAMHIDRPTRRFGCFVGHEHLVFDEDGHNSSNGPNPGQAQFRSDIERIFERNGIAFTVGDDMRVQRHLVPEARPLISDFRPDTGDAELDRLLNEAVTRFLSRIPVDRQDALEKLWDGLERLKTLELGGQKQNSVARLLDNTAPEPFRAVLDEEFTALTRIGNQFRIRHHEHTSHDLPDDATKDYLFIRCASVIAHVLRKTGRMADSKASPSR
ncbi:hypothetical protein AB0C74_11790 [Spirillospora sp. NPDC048832]